jgi:hypothetical protein
MQTTVAGRLTIGGASSVASSTPITVVSPSGLPGAVVNNGTMHWTGGKFVSSSAAGKFVNNGTLESAPGAGATNTISGLAVSNTGRIIMSGATAFKGPEFVQTAGSLELRGHKLSATRPLHLEGGQLSGPGTVDSGLTNAGARIDLATHGTLTIKGTFVQGAAGTLRIEIAGSAASRRDRVVSSAGLRIGGKLLLVRSGSAAVAGYSILTGTSRTGTFSSVAGLSSFHGLGIHYTAKTVRLS